MTCEGLGGCCGDETLGGWWAFKRWCERMTGLDLGPDCVNQTTGGGHASTSLHYGGWAFDASRNFVALARFLVPYAKGTGRIVEELFCSDVGIAYDGGVVSEFHDACCHVHVGIVAGAPLPSTPEPEVEEDEAMGVDSSTCIRPGESIPFRIEPPGGGASGGGYADPVYISVPFDTLDGEARRPGAARWALMDDTGKVIASNDGETPKWQIPMCGWRIAAHPGAYQMTIENKEPAGGRIIGPPKTEWARPRKAGAFAAAAVEPGQAVADIEGEPRMPKADADGVTREPSG